MKKYMCAWILILLFLSGCGLLEATVENTVSPEMSLANPWVSYDTLAQAEAASGFSLDMTQQIGTLRAEGFRVMCGQLMEVRYTDGDFTVTIRKQPGEGQDISGVFKTFEKEIAYESGGSWVVGKFSESESLYLIDSGGYSWSLWAPEGCPVGIQDGFLDEIMPDSGGLVREVNEAFNATITENGTTRSSEQSCFVSCTWECPEEISLTEFLRYCPLREMVADETTAEAQAVIAAMGENPFLVTPVWRYPREAVSALLQKYTGITVEQLLSREEVLYLEEYDAFYNCTSDWGPGRFRCTGGERSGEHIFLRGENGNGESRMLTVREENGAYLLVSYGQ